MLRIYHLGIASLVFMSASCGSDTYIDRAQGTRSAAEEANIPVEPAEEAEAISRNFAESGKMDEVDGDVLEYMKESGIDVDNMTVFNADDDEEAKQLGLTSKDPLKDPAGYVIHEALNAISSGLIAGDNLIASVVSYTVVSAGSKTTCAFAQVKQKAWFRAPVVKQEFSPPMQDNELCKSPVLLRNAIGIGAVGATFVRLFGNNFAGAIGGGIAAYSPRARTLWVGGFGAAGFVSQTFQAAGGVVGAGAGAVQF